MKIRKKINPVLLISGVLFYDDEVCAKAERLLQRKIGKFKLVSDTYPFKHTTYYADELGEDIKRKYIIFDREIDPKELAEIKNKTNTIERILSKDRRRQVNIDPGYLHLAKLVLASAKDFSHRIYIGKGIFAEVTLLFVNKTFQTMPWTYPDYKQPQTIEFFNTVRNEWYDSLRQERKSTVYE